MYQSHFGVNRWTSHVHAAKRQSQAKGLFFD
jgi:hypothetical protein